MKACALLTITRPHLAERARASAQANGWPLLEAQDAERRGAAITRNRLFAEARADGYDYAHFLDDDDELILPPTAFEVCMTARTDLVYHNMECVGREDVNYDGAHPIIDFFRHGAFVGAILLRMDAFQNPFREDQPCMLGSWLFFDSLQSGKTFQHVSATAYRYYTDTSDCQLTKRADFRKRAELFWRNIPGCAA